MKSKGLEAFQQRSSQLEVVQQAVEASSRKIGGDWFAETASETRWLNIHKTTPAGIAVLIDNLEVGMIIPFIDPETKEKIQLEVKWQDFISCFYFSVVGRGYDVHLREKEKGYAAMTNEHWVDTLHSGEYYIGRLR